MDRTILPIDDVLPELLGALQHSPNVVLRAPTAAGKTTRVPAAIFDAGLSDRRQVIVLEPRRLAARAAAAYVADERRSPLGGEVGYHVRFERRAGRETTILYVTDGVFLRMLQDDPTLEQAGAIVFDEFHERGLNSDLALAMTRRVQQELRPDLKIVVMSATLMADPVARYLNDCPVIESQGRLHPVETHYERYSTKEPLDEKVAAAVVRALNDSTGHVLVFLPGVGEIRQAARRLKPIVDANDATLFELFGDMPLDEQRRVLCVSERHKVILATNVAETSLTIESVTAVVDSGLARVLRLDAGTGINRLQIERISRASAEQRAGRAGRTAPGVCYRLWTEQEQRALVDFGEPEIQRVNVAGALVELLAWGEADVRTFPWFEAPPAAALEHALLLLRRLGAVDDRGITALGRRMARLPLQPRLGRLIVEASGYGYGDHAAYIAALLSERDPFLRPPPHLQNLIPRVSDSDLLDRMVAIDDFWSGKHAGLAIDRNAARSVERTYEQLAKLVGQLDIPSPRVPPLSPGPDEAIGRAILAAFPDRVACRREPKSPRAVMVGGRGVRLSEASAVRDAELFVCVDLEETGKSEALVRQASSIDPEWLPADLVRRGVDVEFDAARERVVAFQRTRFEDLVIAESITSVPKDADALSILAREAVARWQPGWLSDEASNSYLARIHSLRQWMPELDLPFFDDAALQSLLPNLCAGCTGLAELRQKPYLHAIKSRLTPAQVRAVEREAPERIVVPSGSHITLAYDPGKPPVLAARIQELFGMHATPRIAGGRVSVVLHLLAPNYRPQQITTDLASFWKTTYAEVRKELRRRYPKHAWPEDPLAAQAQRRPGRR